jgi:tetratricopeptide (TPR) repeat protein
MDLRALAAWACIAGAVAVVYLPAQDAPFVFDDQFTVIENPSLRALWPPSVPLSPPRFFPTAGRPLPNASLAVDFHLGGLDPRGYHRTSFALHALSAGLLLGVARAALGRLGFGSLALPAAALAALLWALHPVQSEPVLYVTQRTELLLGACLLATLYASIRHWTAASLRSRALWLGAAVAACFAGMASKESMAAAPVLVLLFDRAFFAGSLRAALRGSRALYAGLFASWLLLFWLNAEGPRADSAGFHLEVSPVSWWLTQSRIFWIYAKLVVWPWPLSIHYDLPYLETLAEAWPWLLALAAVVAIAATALLRNRPLGFAAACAGALLAPPFVVPIVTEMAAERRLYVPLAALLTLAVATAFRSAPTQRARVAVGAGCLLLAIGYAAIDTARTAQYRDELTLWTATVATQPTDPIARTNLGLALARAGRPDEAQRELERAIEIEPGDADLHFNLANLLADRGRSTDAIERYRTAIGLREDFPGAHVNLGVALAKAGRIDEAVAHLERAIALDPGSELARRNLERARRAQRR